MLFKRCSWFVSVLNVNMLENRGGRIMSYLCYFITEFINELFSFTEVIIIICCNKAFCENLIVKFTSYEDTVFACIFPSA